MKTKRPVINAYVLGCGRISKKHFNAISDLRSYGANLVTVCDLDLEKTKDLDADINKTSDFNLPDPFEGCDLGVILTESGKHFEHANVMLDNGLDLLIEKPAVLRMDHVWALEKKAKILGRKVYVVKQNRYNEPVQKARKIFEAGDLGTLNIGTVRVRWCREQTYYDQADWRGTWELDGGVVANQAIHHIDLLQWFMGPVKSVFARSNNFGVQSIEVEDTLCAVIEFESGALGTIEATTAVRPNNLEGSLSLIGSKGAIEIAGHAVNEMRFIPGENTPNLQKVDDKNMHLVNDVYGSGHAQVYREIIKDRLGHKNSAVTLGESAKSLEFIHMLYKSIESQAPVQYSNENNSSQFLGHKYGN